MDERIYRLVMSRPIPDELIRDLRNAPEPDPYRVTYLGSRNLTASLLETLVLVCHGHTNDEIASLRHYSSEATKDHVKRLLAIFRARNRTHLAAIAIARGIVDLDDAA